VIGQHGTTPQRRAKIIDAIIDYRARYGYPPTFGEIADAVGVNQSTVAHHLTRMRGEGHVRWRYNSPRSVEVVQ